ncbi:HTH-type transcriptional regulator HdfR [Ralstonia pickettii]|uniref:HTH-type transcriptional regulator HdfR n=1 Tax=Ralstonia pickettii TaxID=329 RepID=A0ABN9I1S4_RALPI|nr:HTH-type transcriptional regulator HdfR [Ralstonia pickettii]
MRPRVSEGGGFPSPRENAEQEPALELRLLRYFVAVAEELHFARAAERLGIEQSPVSRAMRHLESRLDVQLFDRSANQTRLTWAGQVFLGECRRVLDTVEQAVSATKAAAQGYQGYLRIAICDTLAQPHIATLLARSREEEPELEIRVFELPFSQQIKGLHNDLLDIGFALSDAVNDGLVAEPVWTDPLSVIVPVRHPLLVHTEVPLDEALKFPLVLCHPNAGSGCHHQIQAVLQGASLPLKLADQVTSLGVMLTLVGAGYGIGFAIASHVQTLNRPDIAVRPLAGTPMLSTYLLRRLGEPSEPIKRFLLRAREEFLPKGDDGLAVWR